MHHTVIPSFHVLEPHSLAPRHQVALQIVWVRPGRVREVILVVRLDLLHLLLLLVVLRHQLYPCLLVNGRLSGGSARPALGQLHEDLGLLVFAGVGTEQFIPEEFLASPPHGGVLGVEVLDRGVVTSIWSVWMSAQSYSP